jgi:hypothetical protein
MIERKLVRGGFEEVRNTVSGRCQWILSATIPSINKIAARI